MTVLTGPINFPYTPIDLTTQVERIPNMYGRLQELNLFPGEGVSTIIVEVAEREGTIVILATEARDGDVPLGAQDTDGSVFLRVPHIPHMEKITPTDLQDKYEIVNGQRVRRGLASETAKKLRRIRMNHGITLEFLRMGALKGLIVDGKNKTVYNLHEVFGRTKKTVFFDLSNAEADIRAKTFEVARHMEDNLHGEVMNGVHALVSKEFFDALIKHANVEKYYLGHAAALGQAGDPRKRFAFGAMVFEEYNAAAADLTKTTRRFIAAGMGHAFPLGTMDTFKTHFAPANHIAMVNTVGTEVFVSPEVLKHGAGVELKSESNPLPICARPELLVELSAAAS